MELSGRSDFLSLFDVAQVLSVNEASGMLRVEDDSGKAYLYFDGGQVINAIDQDRREGEEAAKRVFAMKRARFTFTADLPSVARRIECTTQNLMMEVARALDEESADEDGAGDHLREATEATSTLRELFKRLDSESKVLSHRSPQGFAIADLLGAIKGAPASVLFLRAGAAPEVHVGGRVMPLGQTLLDRPGYEGLRDHLLREAAGGLEGLELGGIHRTLRLSEGEAYRIETLRGGDGEILAIRPVAAGAEGTPWEDDEWFGRLAEPGTLGIVRAFGDRRLDGLIHALLRRLVERDALPILGIAGGWPADARGARAAVVLLRTEYAGDRDGAPGLLDRLAPRFVLIEDADAPGAAALAVRALRRGSRVLVGVRAGRPDLAARRLLDNIPAADRGAATATIREALAVVLDAPCGDEPGRVIPVDEAARAGIAAAPAAPER